MADRDSTGQVDTRSVLRRIVLGTHVVTLFALMAGLLALVQFATPAIVGTDGYYHAKMAYLIRQNGLMPEFIWLPMSILNAHDYYDHHFLYHVYLALFVPGNPLPTSPEALVLGTKIANVLLPALAFLSIWWLLRAQKVHYAVLWSLGLFAVSDAFIYRMSMTRAQSASLLILALSLHCLLTRRHKRLLVLGFVYVWTYNAFPLLLVLAAIYVASTLITERRFEWQPLVWVTAGIVLGLLINPYFPQNIAFITNHILPKMGQSSVRVGNEWYPYETWTFFENSTGALAVCMLGMFALGWNKERIDRPTLTALALTVVFGVMTFRSRRFVEYFPAFALIFGALGLSPLLADFARRSPRWLIPAGLIVMLMAPLARSMLRARDLVADSKPADLYAEAAMWLSQHSPPSSLVFQTDWDDFPRLFFYNTSNIYTIGLDVTYMQLYDSDLYDEWVTITRGRTSHPSEAISTCFGASYIFSDLEHDDFLDTAAEDAGLVEIYRDRYAVIFEVVR